MTIATTAAQATGEGNGASTTWNYRFLIPSAADVVITVTDTTVDPNTTTTIPSSQYTITGINDSNGGVVTYPLSGSPLSSGQYLTIARVLSFVQTTTISNQGDFYPQVVEGALDYLTMCVQQLSQQVADASLPEFTAITGQSPIVVSASGGQYVVSLNPITASSISDSAVTTAKIADGAATLAKLDRTGTTGYVLTAQGTNNAPVWAATSTVSQAPPVRQTVLASAVDSAGLPTFIAAGAGLSVTIAATSVPIYLTAANGFSGTGGTNRIGAISADTSISGLTDATTNYLYADIASNGTVTLGKTTLAPTYQWGGTYSTTNGQFTFNIQEMVGKVGNGSTADQTYRVFIGEAVTSGGAVSSVVNYALMGRYISAYTATLPGASASASFSHNLGTRILTSMPQIIIKCTTTDNGYAVGDVVYNAGIYPNAGDYAPVPVTLTGRNTAQIATGNASTWILVPKAGGAKTVLTLASWSYALAVDRGW